MVPSRLAAYSIRPAGFGKASLWNATSAPRAPTSILAMHASIACRLI